MASTRSIVTIDGIDGSGKSVLARRLMAALEDRAVLFAVDDFRRPVDWSRTDRTPLDLYYDERYDLLALDRCLRAFLEGAPACEYVGYDGARETLGGEPHHVSLAGVTHAIVEGVFVARLVAAAAAFSVVLDIPEAEARRRVMARDLEKGRTLKEVTRRIEQRYLPAHARYQAECRPRDRAAVLVDNRDVNAPRVVRASFPSQPELAAVRRALAAWLGTPQVHE